MVPIAKSRVLVIESSPMILAVIVELAKSAYPDAEILVQSYLADDLPALGQVDVVLHNLTGSLEDQKSNISDTIAIFPKAKAIFLTDFDSKSFEAFDKLPSCLVVSRVLSFQDILASIGAYDSGSSQTNRSEEPSNEYQSHIQYPGADKPLTHRQVQALELAVKGYTVKQMAKEMELSGETVKSHLKQAYERLQARNRAQGICHYLEAKRLSRMFTNT